MHPVSGRFLEALKSSHQMETTVDVLDRGEVVLSLAGQAISSGTVTRDRRAFNYGRCSLQVASETMAPLGPADQLGPAGFELQVSRSIRYSNGETESVPLGVFPIQDAVVDGVNLTTNIEAVDRSQTVSDAKLESAVTYGAGHDVALGILGLLLPILPDVELAVGDDIGLGPGGRVTYDVESDVWAIIQDIYTANGGEAYFDGLGRFFSREEPDVAEVDPVWTVDEGEHGVLLSAELSWSRRPTFNRVIVTGTNQEFGVTYRGVATDSAVQSPSQYGGRFGIKPMFVFSPHVSSTAGAQAAARGILRRKRGVARSLDLSTVPNPALEPGDVVSVTRRSLGLNGLPVVLDSVVVGLGPEDPLTATVRARQEDEIEVS